MKLKISALLVLLYGLSISFQSSADNGVKHVSKLDGVSPMWLFMSNESTPKDLFTDGDDAKLVTHCNGKNKIFVYELASSEFVCKSRYVRKSIDSNNKDYEIDILGIDAKHIKIAGNLIPDGQGIYTISRSIIPQKNWELEPLPLKVISQLQKAAKNNFKCPDNTPCQPLSGLQYRKGFEAYEGQIKVEELEKLAIKIKGNETNILIAPVAIALVGDVDGGTVVYISTVFTQTGESLKLVGSFTGSLIRIGADIDQDGFPEIIVNSSVEYSQVINFFKIYPKVDVLMSYTHW